MPKIGSVYYVTAPEVEGEMARTTFVGALFSKNVNPEDPRKILNLSKYLGLDEDGQHMIAKCTKLVFSDGTEEHIADKILTLKLTTTTKVAKPPEQKPPEDEFKDIPF